MSAQDGQKRQPAFGFRKGARQEVRETGPMQLRGFGCWPAKCCQIPGSKTGPRNKGGSAGVLRVRTQGLLAAVAVKVGRLQNPVRFSARNQMLAKTSAGDRLGYGCFKAAM